VSYVTIIGILGLVAIAACWTLAVVIFRVSTTGSTARKLAWLLVIEGFVLVTAGFPAFAFGIPDSYFESRPVLSIFVGLVHHLGDATMIALYPPFLAMALNTSITRPFLNTRVCIGLAIVAAIVGLLAMISPSQITITLLYLSVTLLFVYALVASIHAWRTAKSGIVRERAGVFALAFGLRDLGWTMSYAVFAWLMWTQPELPAMPDIGWFGKLVYALGTLLAVPLIAYGILRTQLFDIDLRIRWTIKQSTLAGIFECHRPADSGCHRVLCSAFAALRRSRGQRRDAEHQEHAGIRDLPQDEGLRSGRGRSAAGRRHFRQGTFAAQPPARLARNFPGGRGDAGTRVAGWRRMT